MKFWVALVALLGAATSASAAWHKASSDHFVIYSDSRADDVRQFSEMLERFHRAMQLHSGRAVEVPSPSSRVTIFVVGSETRLRELYGDRGSNVAGFYIPRAGGSVAYTPSIRYWEQDGFDMQILLHEYAHHFLIYTSRHAMPRWLSEGAAEFYGSARFHRDGGVDVGMPNNHRAYELANAADVPIRALLDQETYAERRSGRYDAFYGRAWLLFHYLSFSPERAGQLGRYWQAVAGGMPSLEAAESVFGDLDALERELRQYNHRRTFSATRYTATQIKVGKVDVRALSPGMDEMMEVILRSRRGVDEEEAGPVLENARRIAASYPGDADVLAALAEAENDAGNSDAAIAVADRALALAPETKEALVQKGRALFALAAEADDVSSAYDSAMKPFLKLNALENDHPLPLLQLYRSEVRQGQFPSEVAQAALERASQLAPFDQHVTMELGRMMAARGDIRLAAMVLAPVAANPHGGKGAQLAKSLIETLDAAPEGKRFDFGTLATMSKDEGDDEDEAFAPLAVLANR